VGYHYEQWARVSAYAQGLGVRTRDNPDFTMLDDALRPRWSVQVTTARSTYDASDRTYLVATLPDTAPPTLVALDADSGARRWCRRLTGGAVSGDMAVSTQFLDDDGVVVQAAGEVVRLGPDGQVRWHREVKASEGDFLGPLGDGLLLAGGQVRGVVLETPELALVTLEAGSGRVAWRRPVPAGTSDHVLGTDPAAGIALVEERTQSGSTLLALDRTGREMWRLPGAGVDTAIRAGRVLARTASTWSAYDVATGRRLWSVPVPQRPQFLPYGYELDSIPLLDADHALVGSTTALRTLDLRTGAMTSAPLPTDGISTTYWPYELAVTDSLLAVATNTGAVVVRREE
jgi:outer membrane protein assembly factor BamB